jgi:RNA polymerase sigma-70 factor (ECF subfamily)
MRTTFTRATQADDDTRPRHLLQNAMNRPPFACALRAWDEHQSELKGYLIHRLADPPLAEDVLQEIFTRVLREGEKFCTLDNPRAWLFQVARNAVVDHLRCAKSGVPLPEDLAQEEEGIAPLDAPAECLERVLSELSADDGDVVRRCHLDGIKLQTYADEHGLTLPAVKSRLQRARQRIRDLSEANS